MKKIDQEEKGESPKRERGVYERRQANGGVTPKKYGNRLRWDEKTKRYTFDDPDNLLKEN